MTCTHDTRIRPAPSLAALALVLGAWLALAGVASAAPAETTGKAFFSNSAPISIPEKGTASPYPSLISVGGVSGLVTDVTVTLHGFQHSRPDDVDILLASPEGDASILMSDACAFDKNKHTWVFSETLIGGPVPPSGQCNETVYRPTDILQSDGGGPDSWPLAPPGNHPADLDRFVGENPNGTWRLFVLDDLRPIDAGAGSIAQGWSLGLDIEVPDALVPAPSQGGLASPYPITRTLAGVDGVISDLNVRLNSVYHELAADVELALVGPHGQRVLLMSDACGVERAKNAYWVWDDEAAGPMTTGGSCPNGSYRPTDVLPGDSLPGPAPAAPYASALSAFDGTDPNGEWRLFAYDDKPGNADAGFFVERFTLEVETRPKARTSFAAGALELAEGQAGELTIARDSGARGFGEGTVTVTTEPLSATAGSDFEPILTTIEFARGQQQASVPVRALADALAEGEETFVVTLGKPTGDVDLAAPSTAVVAIRNEGGGSAGGGSGGGGPGSGGSGSGTGADRTAPETRIVRGPKRRTSRRTARFRFTANEPGVRFECKLDRRKWKPCSSPRTLKRLRVGRHRFAVRAVDAAGNVDPTPAKRRWQIVK